MSKLAVVIPVRNEVVALPHVITSLIQTLDGLNYQIIIVDDGDDNTPEVIGKMHISSLTFVRRSVGERNGLAGAVIAGFVLAADSTYVATMDGDGQHPPEIIRCMINKAVNNRNDMIMVSRYISGGSTGGLDGKFRKFYSTFLRMLPRVFFPKRVGAVTDPLSGCFLVKTECLNLDLLKPIGWKIGLEVLLSSSINRYGEIGYEFQERIGGESKADLKIGLDYFRQLASLVVRFYFN
jgi:glycosyltransferase involved in cell wall biosynthesis